MARYYLLLAFRLPMDMKNTQINVIFLLIVNDIYYYT